MPPVTERTSGAGAGHHQPVVQELPCPGEALADGWQVPLTSLGAGMSFLPPVPNSGLQHQTQDEQHSGPFNA